MKKQFLKSLALVAMLLCGLTASASSGLWCEKRIGHEKADGADGADVNSYVLLTVKNNGDGTITFTVANDPGKNSKDVDYILINPGYGSAGTDVDSKAPMSQSVTYTLPAGKTELTGVEILWSNSGWGGRWMVKGLNIDVSEMCTDESVEKETIKPVMGEATLASVTYNSAVVNVAGTDKETENGEVVAVTRFKVVYGETTKIYTATDEKITITGLNAGTPYSFEIYAVDKAGNVSDNSASVKATTESRESQCSGECGHFGTPDVKRIAYTIAYDPTEKAVVYTISALNGKKLDFMEVNTTKGNYRVAIPTNDSTTCTFKQTGVTVGEEMGIRFLYSTDEIGGNEMTAAEVSMSDPNIIYYKVGDCAMVIEEDTEKPVMVSASLVSNTYNSAVIAVVANDNKGVVSYKVVDAEKEFNANFAAVDGKITVTGLTQSTTYNLAISAVDRAGNVSEAAKTVVVTTDQHLYAPVDVPAAPVHEASKVISIYSDTYESNGYTHGEWEGGSAMTDKEIAGNHYNLYTFGGSGNGNYFGLELGKEIDVTDMKKLHLDIWSEVDIQALRVFPIWKVATGGANGTEISQVVTLKGQQWNSIDLTLADYVGVNTWEFVYQIKLDGMARYVVALDNIYFWKDGTSTAVDANEVATKVSKMIENGQVVIIREGVKYDVTGRAIER